MKSVIVIGGGASGLMAAITAARHGAAVTVLEQNKRTGQKLLVTGNGRCNFTNRDQELSHYRTEDPSLAAEVLAAYPMEETVRFFEELGIAVKERSGCLYPASLQASSVAEVLRLEAVRLRVKLACSTKGLSAMYTDAGFEVQTEGWTYRADALILACGSPAAPETGASADGYRLAEAFGHHVTEPLPALTGLCAAEKDCGTLSGVRADAQVELFADGVLLAQDAGEVQFASYGLSGIPVFQVSRYASRALSQGKRCEVFLDLSPSCTEEEVIRRFQEKLPYIGSRSGSGAFLGVFPEKLAGALLLRAGILKTKPCGEWNDRELKNLAGQIKAMRFTVTRCRGYGQAQVSTGGVPLRELSGSTMESAIVPGLYFAGELLDVDGACGGYNLQWAWSSGHQAGLHAAED